MALGPLVGIRRAYRTGANPPGGGPSCRTGMSFTLAIPGFFLIIASVIFTDFQMLPIPILLLLPLFVRFLELFFEDVDTEGGQSQYPNGSGARGWILWSRGFAGASLTGVLSNTFGFFFYNFLKQNSWGKNSSKPQFIILLFLILHALVSHFLQWFINKERKRKLIRLWNF